MPLSACGDVFLLTLNQFRKAVRDRRFEENGAVTWREVFAGKPSQATPVFRFQTDLLVMNTPFARKVAFVLKAVSQLQFVPNFVNVYRWLTFLHSTSRFMVSPSAVCACSRCMRTSGSLQDVRSQETCLET